jgi:hypothetical protein
VLLSRDLPSFCEEIVHFGYRQQSTTLFQDALESLSDFRWDLEELLQGTMVTTPQSSPRPREGLEEPLCGMLAEWTKMLQELQRGLHPARCAAYLGQPVNVSSKGSPEAWSSSCEDLKALLGELKQQCSLLQTRFVRKTSGA